MVTLIIYLRDSLQTTRKFHWLVKLFIKLQLCCNGSITVPDHQNTSFLIGTCMEETSCIRRCLMGRFSSMSWIWAWVVVYSMAITVVEIMAMAFTQISGIENLEMMDLIYSCCVFQLLKTLVRLRLV